MKRKGMIPIKNPPKWYLKELEKRFNPLLSDEEFTFKDFYYYWDDEDKKRFGCIVMNKGVCYDNSTQLIREEVE